MLWFYENDSILNATFFGSYKYDTGTFNKNKRCYMTLDGLAVFVPSWSQIVLKITKYWR